MAVAGCGSDSNSTSGTDTGGKVIFAKTRFALHAGLAFGAFHRYIYKPYKAGKFKNPSQNKAALVKAGLAGAFAYHEVKVAIKFAKADETLSKLVPKLTSLQALLTSLSASLKNGKLPTSQLESANTSISEIGGDSSSAGTPVTDKSAPIPGF
jgi:hypothetical protein